MKVKRVTPSELRPRDIVVARGIDLYKVVGVESFSTHVGITYTADVVMFDDGSNAMRAWDHDEPTIIIRRRSNDAL